MIPPSPIPTRLQQWRNETVFLRIVCNDLDKATTDAHEWDAVFAALVHIENLRAMLRKQEAAP